MLQMSSRVRYEQLLQTADWRAFSWRCKSVVGFQCEHCATRGEEKLETHHWWYESGRMPWEVEPGQVCVMCGECHASMHAEWETLKRYVLTQMGETPEARLFLRLFRRWLFRGFTAERLRALNVQLMTGRQDGGGPLASGVASVVAGVLGVVSNGQEIGARDEGLA